MLPNIAPMIPPAPPALLHKLRTFDQKYLKKLDASSTLPSPCVSVCQMDEAREYCIGCLRTLEELRAWGNADAATKCEIWQRVRIRATTSTST